MELEKIIKERYSVRKFSDKEIEQEKLDKILDAGRIAPTAANSQPQKIFVIKSEESKEKLKSVCKCTFNAPITLIVCADMRNAWNNKLEDGYTSAEMDVSIVGTHMMLEAWNLNIGSCWIRAFNSNEVREAFNFPENIKPMFLLSLGYEADDYEPSMHIHLSRKDIEDEVIYI